MFFTRMRGHYSLNQKILIGLLLIGGLSFSVRVSAEEFQGAVVGGPEHSVAIMTPGEDRSLAPPAENPDTAGHTVREIDEFVLTQRRVSVKTTTVAPVQSFSAAEISELGIQNMADAVRRFAGTNVRDYGGIGGLKTVSVRNMGAAHTAVSYDGVPVSNCQAGQIDIGRFSLDNVGMLSLAVGQAPDMLQSARLYASAAVLGIETKKPIFENGHKSSFLAKISGGSFGYISPNFRWWQKIGSRVTTTLDATFLYADGHYPFTLQNGSETLHEKRNNSQVSSWHAEANVNYDMPSGGDLQLKGYYFYSRRGLPGAVILYNPVSTEKLFDENAFLQVRIRKKFSPKWMLQAQGKYNYGWNKDWEASPQYSGGIYEALHRQNEYYLSATGLYRPIGEVSLALAQDFFANTLRSTMFECPDPDRFSSITAISARWERSRFNLTATLTGTYITERVKTGESPSDIRHLNPTVGFNLKLLNSYPLYGRLMYKTTFRVPSFNDLYYDRLGSRHLKPEKANEYNLGLTWSGSLFEAMDYLALTADGYYNNVTDKIVAFPTTYAWRMTNYGKVRITGLDLTLATAFTLPRNFKLVVSGAYTLQRAIDITDRKAKNYKAQIPYTPRHSGNASLLIENPYIDLAYTVVAVGKRYYMAENIPTNEISGYVEQNLTLSRNFDVKGCLIDLRAEITNLFNRQYEIIKYYPMPGRAWRLVAALEF